MPRKRDQLLQGFLEGISWRVLEDYKEIISNTMAGQAGVYALYKQEKLYYVGLASNLMRRIKQHLKDRHAGRWDRFSVYLTKSDKHVKQLESLVLRIIKPHGNRRKGGFGHSANMFRALERAMGANDADRRATALGGMAMKNRRRRKTASARGTLVLAGLVERQYPLRARYKGIPYKGTLRRDGRISVAGRQYDSPSAAAHSITGRGVNGWVFWEYKRGAHDWPELRELRGPRRRR